MEAVENAGREALQELRQVLGVLRADQPDEALGPMHGLTDIPGLVAEVNDAGMDVSLVETVTLHAVPAALDLASYRIVQEALTNVRKHAGPDPTAEVRITTDERFLAIEIADRGRGAPTSSGTGHGLVGMRERVALLGGTFEAGQRPGGGFRIFARLPMERSPS